MGVRDTSRHTTPERLIAALRIDILSGRLAPGEPLREEELSRSLGVSRHVIRETLRLLVAEGLAEYSAFKGARVFYISIADVSDIYQARRFCEISSLYTLLPPTIELLARIHISYANSVAAGRWSDAFRLDAEFHGAIIADAGSKRLQSWHAELFKTLSLAHHVRPEFREHGLRASVAEHGEIITALRAGDRARAVSALAAHLTVAEGLLTKRISEQAQSSGKH